MIREIFADLEFNVLMDDLSIINASTQSDKMLNILHGFSDCLSQRFWVLPVLTIVKCLVNKFLARKLTMEIGIKGRRQTFER